MVITTAQMSIYSCKVESTYELIKFTRSLRFFVQLPQEEKYGRLMIDTEQDWDQSGYTSGIKDPLLVMMEWRDWCIRTRLTNIGVGISSPKKEQMMGIPFSKGMINNKGCINPERFATERMKTGLYDWFIVSSEWEENEIQDGNYEILFTVPVKDGVRTRYKCLVKNSDKMRIHRHHFRGWTVGSRLVYNHQRVKIDMNMGILAYSAGIVSTDSTLWVDRVADLRNIQYKSKQNAVNKARYICQKDMRDIVTMEFGCDSQWMRHVQLIYRTDLGSPDSEQKYWEVSEELLNRIKNHPSMQGARVEWGIPRTGNSARYYWWDLPMMLGPDGGPTLYSVWRTNADGFGSGVVEV